MKRLVVLAVIAFAAWYGWHHYHDLLTKIPQHEAVIRNESGHPLTRVRLHVGGRAFVREELPVGQSATFRFAVQDDSKFDLLWEYGDTTGEGHWVGGGVTKGPMVERHTLTVRSDGGVIYESMEIRGET
jgi:hypothetical protein